jgi:molybdate/tungstate transport system substrate-binding protein
LFVKRLEQMIRFVDQLLNTLAGGIGGTPIQKRAHDGKRNRRANSGYADPDQRAGESVRAAVILVVHVEREIMRTILLLLTALALAGATTQPADVVVAYAGSLVTPMEGPIATDVLNSANLHLLGEGKGSKALEHLIESGLRKPDVFISADSKLVDALEKLGLVESRATFASASMVLGYSTLSPHRALFESAASGKTSLLEVLRTPGLTIGRTDPALDPKGERTLRSLALMKLPQDLGSIYPEEDLLARLETGTLDAAFLYSTESVARHVPAIQLPGSASLSGEITYTLAVMKAAPHPQAALTFARYIEAGSGRQIFEAAGLHYLH